MEKMREKVTDERRRRITEGAIMWRKGYGTSGERGNGKEEEKERRQ